ncbi:hypothetical protein BCR44DRAFT_277873 [Catenaria anguillulae PL171]|uniref:Uncharacterized protein n=1 Tax=Catenaria anguillulae PL171 TaxID=765915 RepID=A0A1Y2H638_9FUNG|nr:hypothetical protein BCR44DRAFT_277873 [Catenaria anguillulae PL171]
MPWLLTPLSTPYIQHRQLPLRAALQVRLCPTHRNNALSNPFLWFDLTTSILVIGQTLQTWQGIRPHYHKANMQADRQFPAFYVPKPNAGAPPTLPINEVLNLVRTMPNGEVLLDLVCVDGINLPHFRFVEPETPITLQDLKSRPGLSGARSRNVSVRQAARAIGIKVDVTSILTAIAVKYAGSEERLGEYVQLGDGVFLDRLHFIYVRLFPRAHEFDRVHPGGTVLELYVYA